MRCAIYGCNSDNQVKSFNGKIKFYRFPQDAHLSKIWLNACARADKINVKTARVCSLHFNSNSFNRDLRYELLNYAPRNQRDLKYDAIPTINLHSNNKNHDSQSETRRQVRARNRERIKYISDTLESG